MEREFIQEQNDLRDDYKIKIQKSTYVEILRGRQTRGTICIFIFAVVVPIVIYYFIFDKSTFPPEMTDTCAVDNTYKIPCGRKENVTMDYCDSIRCCFDNSTQRCFHYLPSRYYYSLQDGVYRRSLNTTPFGRNQELTVKVSINELSENTVQVVLHEPSVSITTVNNTSNISYYYNLTENLYVDVYRKNNNQRLLTTAKGPTIISDNYWEWSFQLTDKYLFGLGQTLIDLDENSTLTKVIYGNHEEHNVLPSFLAYDNGSYHGLVVRHSGPLEVTVLPSNLVLLKSLVGGQIMLELTVGPTLKDVIIQQNTLQNARNIVDIKTLGVHVCREGSVTTLDEILNVVKIDDTFQYDSDCLHENLFLARMNEEDPDTIEKMETLIASLTATGRSFVLSLPPHVPTNSPLYQATESLDIFFKNTTAVYQGKYQDLDVVYPYFKHPEIDTFVQELITQVDFVGSPSYLVLSQNWPLDDSFTMQEINSFQYLSEELINAMSFTLPWNITVSNQSQFVDHNEYGASHFTQIKAKKPGVVVMTASHTFDTAAPIVIQNVNISWTNFRKAITTTLFNSITGFPLTSIPVCGSTSVFNQSYESLCMRWYLMASTAPIFRISSDEPRRDPSSLATISQYAANIAKEAIDFRYKLLHYFYGVLSTDEPLMRPMFYDFPDDQDTFGLVDQYMVGPDLLVAHPTLPGQSQLKVYLPKRGSTWFSFNGGLSWVGNSTNKGWVTLAIVETDWIGFIREGAVIPMVENALLQEATTAPSSTFTTTTKASPISDITLNSDSTPISTTHTTISAPTPPPPIPVNLVTLKVALKCDGTENCTATGTLNIDASSYVNFSVNESEITVENISGPEDFLLDRVEIFKAGDAPMYFQAAEWTRIIDITSCSYSVDSFVCL